MIWIGDMLRFRRPGQTPTLFLVVDEVSQYVLHHDDRTTPLAYDANAGDVGACYGATFHRGAKKLYNSSRGYLQPYGPVHEGLNIEQLLAQLRLRPDSRDAQLFELLFAGGHAVEDVARELGMTVGAVTAWRYRVRRHARALEDGSGREPRRAAS